MASQANRPLANGYQLLDYRIERALNSGGFSIVYLARDEDERPVAIKEYLPSSMVLRREGDRVQAASAECLASFRHGMKCFFEEGRALAKINHPNVVRVENFFRANDTVYLVMRYLRGRTLQFHIPSHRKKFSDAFLRRLFSNLLTGLREVHTHKLIHLDIKPANIYITVDGTPVLLDFGSARLALDPEGPLLKPMYTQGFAAPEQYQGLKGLGPWTDIYSVGATMYSCLSGAPPQAADSRLKDDRLVAAKKNWAGQFSDQLLETIDSCLRLDPLERPQSVFGLQKILLEVGEPSARKSKLLGSLRRKLEIANTR
jgi:serine/threonine protein kinase